METLLHVAMPPRKPVMIFDGDCRFCALWIKRWKSLTGAALDYVPSREPRIALEFPDIPPAQYNIAVLLVATDGAVYSAAEAVFRALAENPKWRWPLRAYKNFPLFAKLSESAYRFVARHRSILSKLAF